jgi:hypothetical protein
MRSAAILFAFSLAAAPVLAETVDVKFVGPVDLQIYECQTITRSSFINRVCYDELASKMIILLRATTYYAYCRVPKCLVDAFLGAESMGRFYNTSIKSSAVAGAYDCID